MADFRARRREHRDRGSRLSPSENNGEADNLDSSGTPSKLDVSGDSRVAARRRERAGTGSDSPGDAADAESRGAAGGSSSRKAKDKKGTDSKAGRFAQRKKREKRRGTGVVVLEDDDTASVTASVKETTDYNEEITKPDHDHHGNGTTNSYETPTQRRQATPIRDDESANGSAEGSRIRSRRRQGRESLDAPVNTSSPASPRTILRREVDGRTAEEWKRMYDREHRENRRLTRRLHEAEEKTARLEDEIHILTEDLEIVDEELDRSREENRALNKAMSNLRVNSSSYPSSL